MKKEEWKNKWKKEKWKKKRKKKCDTLKGQKSKREKKKRKKNRNISRPWLTAQPFFFLFVWMLTQDKYEALPPHLTLSLCYSTGYRGNEHTITQSSRSMSFPSWRAYLNTNRSKPRNKPTDVANGAFTNSIPCPVTAWYHAFANASKLSVGCTKSLYLDDCIDKIVFFRPVFHCQGSEF